MNELTHRSPIKKKKYADHFFHKTLFIYPVSLDIMPILIYLLLLEFLILSLWKSASMKKCLCE